VAFVCFAAADATSSIVFASHSNAKFEITLSDAHSTLYPWPLDCKTIMSGNVTDVFADGCAVSTYLNDMESNPAVFQAMGSRLPMGALHCNVGLYDTKPTIEQMCSTPLWLKEAPVRIVSLKAETIA